MLDKSVCLRCIKCHETHPIVKGQSDHLVDLSKRLLENKLKKLHQKDIDHPLEAFDLSLEIHQTTQQIDVLTQFLDPNAPLFESSGIEEADLLLADDDDSNLPANSNLPADSTVNLVSIDNTGTVTAATGEKFNQSKSRRAAGEGSGEIYYRKSKPKEGKTYNQMFFRVSHWRNGQRQWRRSFYIPRRLEEWVKTQQEMRTPINIILERIAPNFQHDTL